MTEPDRAEDDGSATSFPDADGSWIIAETIAVESINAPSP